MGLRDLHHGSPREVAHAISLSRRNFLRSVTGAGAATAFFGASPLRGMVAPRGKEGRCRHLWRRRARRRDVHAGRAGEHPPPAERIDPAGHVLHAGGQSRHSRPLRRDRQHRDRRVRDVQQFRGGVARQSHGLRILPQGPQASGHRLLGGGAQQRVRAHRRERAQVIRPGDGRGSDPAEASAVRGAIRGRRWRALPASSPRQLRDAASTRPRSRAGRSN